MDTELYFTVVFYVLTVTIGLCVGSFLNVVIYRVPLKMSVAFPPSHCPGCDHAIKWYDNIPVLSYILLGGKCRFCKMRISPRYTAVEISNTLLWLACALMFRENILYAVISMAAMSVCICIFFIDLEYMLIFDRFQIILAVLAVLATVTDGYAKWYSHIIGGIAAGGLFLLIGLAAEKILGKEALGGGDVKLAAGMGLFLGWEKTLLTMLIASVTASIVLVVLGKKNGKGKEYPFAPFLTAGFTVSLIFGEQIISFYLSALGL